MSRRWFAGGEAEEIRSLLDKVRRAERPEQKVLRKTLRSRFRFFISELMPDSSGMTRSDFDELVARGVIRIVENAEAGIPMTSPEDFEFWTREAGVVVITDSARSPRALMHPADSPHVAREHFEEKVHLNQQWNGTYSWFPSRQAAAATGAQRCSTCAW